MSTTAENQRSISGAELDAVVRLVRLLKGNAGGMEAWWYQYRELSAAIPEWLRERMGLR